MKNFEKITGTSGEPTTEDVHKYIDKASEKYSESSLQQNLSILKAYWKTMQLPGDIDTIIEMRSPSVSMSSHQKTVYSEEEVAEIVEEAESPWDLFFILTYTYARRLKEVALLQTQDVSESQIVWSIVKRASSDRRKLPRSWLPEEWDACLESRKEEHDKYIFPECWRSNGEFKYWIPQNKMRAVCTSLGIEGTSIHGLRHSRARHLLDSGLDFRTVKDGILFHERLSITQDIYGTEEEAEEEIPGVSL